MYFNNCYTADQCKAQYRELAKQLHSDKQGGSSAAFQKMQQEYEARLRELLAQQEAGYGNPADFQNLIRALLEVVKTERKQQISKQFKKQTIMATAKQLAALKKARAALAKKRAAKAKTTVKTKAKTKTKAKLKTRRKAKAKANSR